MKCVSDIHYKVTREWSRWQKAHWWNDAREEPHGDLKSLNCAFCDFKVLKRYIRKPRTSTSGLGRYNVMRGAMIKHLHERHRDQLDE